MSKLHPIFYTLRADAHISVNKALSHAIGLIEATLYSELLSRRFYFEAREELTPDGFFFNTVKSLWEGTTLSPYQQRAALKVLVEKGLIVVRVSGIPAKRYFKIVNDHERMQELLEIGQENARKFPVSHSSEKTSPLDIKKVNGNNINQDEAVDPELMRELSILVSGHQQAKPTSKQLMQRTHSLKAQGSNGHAKVR